MMKPPAAIEIQQSASEIVIRDDRAGESHYRPDGSKQRVPAFGDRDADVVAKWKSDKLVITSDVDEGPSIRDVYEIKGDGHQLIDTRTVSGRNGRFSLKLRLVYDLDTVQ